MNFFDQRTIQTRAQVLEKFVEGSLELRQADKNWRMARVLSARDMADKMIASHGTDREQGWWYASDGTRIRLSDVQ